MKLLILSDLHIKGPSDPLYPAFLEILRSRLESGDRLIMAGDIFDLFVGGKNVFLDPYREYFEALRQLDLLGVAVDYIEGNHDFHLRSAYQDFHHFRLHPNQIQMELSGKKFLVVHGDTIDRNDYGYRGLRLFLRSPVMKILIQVSPGRFLQALGQKSSRLSRFFHPQLEQQSDFSERDLLRRKYRNFAAEKVSDGFDFVVAGHCHDRDEMRFQVDGRQGQYINIGYPKVHRSYLSWTPDQPWIVREDFPRTAFDRW